MDGDRHVFPSSKKINIGITSSLSDLKAELLKRKTEASNKQNNASTSSHQPGKEKWQSLASDLMDKSSEKKKNTKQKLPQKPKDEASIELDRQLMLSKASLERKAKLYEERYNQAKAGILNGNDSSSDDDWDNENGPNSLVDFREKIRLKIEMPRPRTPSPVPIEAAGDEDLVEFTDSFGRTRKCLKKNLPHYKKMDEEAKLIARSEEQEANESEDENDTRTWEEVKPVGPVRYQELVQDEIRDHGVGFFRFSEDEDVRRQQLKTLEEIHRETMKQRKLARIRKRAERNERRAKQAAEQGVPIESIPEEQSSDEDEPLPESFDQLSERDKEALALKELLTREWDAGKRDAMGRIVKESPSSSSTRKRVTAQMASKTLTEERRQEREAEFAPPSIYFDPPPNRQFNAFPATKRVKENESPTTSNIEQIISEKLAQFKKGV
jgi:hypothetical protein